MKYMLNSASNTNQKHDDRCAVIEYDWHNRTLAVEENVATGGSKTFVFNFDLDFKMTPENLEYATNFFKQFPNAYALMPTIETVDQFATALLEAGIQDPKVGARWQVTSWELLRKLYECGATFFLLGEPLVFHVDAVRLSKSTFDRPVFYAMIPNAVAAVPYCRDILQFWVLPQHMHFYEDAFDYAFIPFTNIVQTTSTVQSYWSDEPYNFAIYLLIRNMDSSYKTMGKWFDDKFAKTRLNCKHLCAQNPNFCQICARENDMFQYILSHQEEMGVKI